MPRARDKTEAKLCQAALKLAATREWFSLTLPQIAKAARISLSITKRHFADRDQLLPAIVTYIDDQVAKAIGKPLSGGTPPDRLFEVMMARFDILQINREAILGIKAALRQNPRLAAPLLPAQVKAMKKMLSLAGLKISETHQPLVVGGLLAIYGAALWRWQFDTTADLAKTMAALDRSLRIAAKFMAILLRQKS